jgi:outer membrane protein assembly factor BamB
MKLRNTFHERVAAWGFVVLLLGAAWPCSAGEWPGWRGPRRTGHTDEAGLPLSWDGKTKQNVLWKAAADFGHSSPIVWGSRVFLTASVLKVPRGSQQKANDQRHRVACYRTSDGKKLWQTDVEPGLWDTEFSFTAATPVTDGKRVYALFGSGTIVALDFMGKLLWQKKLPGPFKAEWLSSSPLLYRDTLFVFVDVSDDVWMLALDKKTGAVQRELKRKQNARGHNSSPLLLSVQDKVQLLIAGGGAVQARDPISDKVIWSCKWGGNRYPSLVSGSGLVFVTGEGGESLAIDPGGEGDVSKSHVKWRLSKTPQGFGSPLIVGDYLYRASPPGIIRCWKMADGQLVYEERLEGVPTYTSPVATRDGRIYLAGSYKSYVLKAGPQLQVLAKNILEVERSAEGFSSGPSLAVSNGSLFLRSPRALFCIGKK